MRPYMCLKYGIVPISCPIRAICRGRLRQLRYMCNCTFSISRYPRSLTQCIFYYRRRVQLHKVCIDEKHVVLYHHLFLAGQLHPSQLTPQCPSRKQPAPGRTPTATPTLSHNPPFPSPPPMKSRTMKTASSSASPRAPSTPSTFKRKISPTGTSP